LNIFVRDTVAGTTTRVEGGGASRDVAFSENGRYVVFSSFSDATEADEGGGIFLYDLTDHHLERVSVNDSGQAADELCLDPSISPDGRFVVFDSIANNLDPRASHDNWQLFVRDRDLGTTRLLTVDRTGGEANDESGNAALSADGRYIAFDSWASDLVAGDINDSLDVYLRDTVKGSNVRISVPDPRLPFEFDADSEAPSISADGRYIAFSSEAGNLVLGDTNGSEDVFVRDVQAGTTTRVSVSSSGEEGDQSSYSASMSADGRYVAFASVAAHLVADHPAHNADIYLHDMQTGETTLVSEVPGGGTVTGDSESPKLSGDGRFIAFVSSVANLVPGDTNDADDIFLRGPLLPAPYSIGDAAAALRIAAGLMTPTTDQSVRLGIAPSAGVDLRDAVSIARLVAGLT
jgi:Tol biopolymer transport system component